MPTTTKSVTRPRSDRGFNQAIERGYLIDDYMSPQASTYITACWRNHLPSVVVSPWRRHWYSLRVDMPSAYRLSSEAVVRLTQHIGRAQANGFAHTVRYLPGGFQVWGILPEQVERLAFIVATIVNDPDQTIPRSPTE